MRSVIQYLLQPFLCFIIVITLSCRRDTVITTRTLLSEMTDRESITRFPDNPYKLVQYSSYDRRSTFPDSAGWFANADFTQFIREESYAGRKEYVMFEADGPGAVVRWWMTFGNHDAMESYIRVYIDGSKDPVLEGKAPDLVGGGILAPEPLSTSVAPQTDPQRRGYNLYLPLPFKKQCKITLSNENIEISPSRRYPSIYYSVSARIYNPGTRVESVTMKMLNEDTVATQAYADLLRDHDDSRIMNGKDNYINVRLEPGSSYTVRIKGKDMAIGSLAMKTDAPGTADVLRRLNLMISFDGVTTVDLPAGNFFCSGYEINPYTTFYSRVKEDGMMISGHIMPFRKECMITLMNNSDSTIEIMADAVTVKYMWDKSSLYFGSAWHEYSRIETGGTVSNGGDGRHLDINFADIQGKGVYAGDAIVVKNNVDAWWGEGDEKIYVDGESFPSSFGTGTEDYYGYAWCRPERFSHPFIAQPAGEGNLHPGWSVNIRYRSLDAIPFNTSISANIELWHWVKTEIDYSLTTFFYVMPGFNTVFPSPSIYNNPTAQ